MAKRHRSSRRRRRKKQGGFGRVTAVVVILLVLAALGRSDLNVEEFLTEGIGLIIVEESDDADSAAGSGGDADSDSPDGGGDSGSGSADDAGNADSGSADDGSGTESDDSAGVSETQIEYDGEYIVVDADDDFDLDGIEIPEYDGEEIIEINDGETFFEEDEYVTTYYIQITELDALGRCGSAVMCAVADNMQDGERDDISDIHPTGWHSGSIYNRSHLLMWKLSGCDDERNLITGTEDFNQVSMLDYEYDVMYYLYENEDMHVMYRVTPLFLDDELVARGVLMEAVSVEDDGAGLEFCVFCYNVEDGYEIDYETGDYTGSGS